MEGRALVLIEFDFDDTEVVPAPEDEVTVGAVEVGAVVTMTPTASWTSLSISAGALFDLRKLMNCTDGFFLKVGKSCKG